MIISTTILNASREHKQNWNQSKSDHLPKKVDSIPSDHY